MRDDLLQTYDILERIGEGSGGIIYKAYHKRLQKMVVLKKIIDPGHSVERNRQEVDILKNINHSYLPQVLDFFETPEGTFTVMNYIPGKSFQQLLKEGVRFAKEDLLRWALQICSALNYLHTRKIPIIHGDIKPSNIMLKPDGDICLIDFNISFYFDHNTVLGCTRGYSSPEQFWAVSSRKRSSDQRFVIDNKADIYSVGATLYHLATGNVRADHTHEIDTGRLIPIIGEPFARVIAKATALNPADRYQTAYEMYQALKAVPGKSLAGLQSQRKEKKKTVWLICALIAVLCIGAGGFLAYHKHIIKEYDSYVQEARAAVLAGDTERAKDASEKAIRLMDKKAEGYYWRDYLLYTQGQYEGCCAQLTDDIGRVSDEGDSLDETKSVADLYCLLGTSFLQAGQSDNAISAFAEAEEKYSPLMRAEHYRDYAVALARAGQPDSAGDMLDRAKEAKGTLPDYSLAYTEGEIEYQKGEDEDALRSFREAVSELEDMERSTEENDLFYRACDTMYRIHRDRNEYSDCISVMLDAEKMIENSVWQTQIDRNLGAAYDGAGDRMEAAERYRKAACSQAGTWSDWSYAAHAYFNGGSTDLLYGLREDYANRNGEDSFGYWYMTALSEYLAQNQKPNGTQDFDRFLEFCDYAEETAGKRPGEDNQRELSELEELKQKVWEGRDGKIRVY